MSDLKFKDPLNEEHMEIERILEGMEGRGGGMANDDSFSHIAPGGENGREGEEAEEIEIH